MYSPPASNAYGINATKNSPIKYQVLAFAAIITMQYANFEFFVVRLLLFYAHELWKRFDSDSTYEHETIDYIRVLQRR